VLALVALIGVWGACGALGQTDNADPLELARSGDYAAAARALEDMVEAGNRSPAITEALIESWIRQGMYAQALERFEAFTAASPDSAPLRLAAAKANRLTGNYERAIEHVDQALVGGSLAPLNVAVMHEKAVLLRSTGRADEATTLYDTIVDGFLAGTIVESESIPYVAESMWATDYVADANDVFRFAVEANPRDPDIQVRWGDMLSAKYQRPEALASYEDALALDPNHPDANLGLARLLADENVESSEARLDAALAANPNLPEAHLLVARQRITAEQYDEADEETRKALDVNPRMPEALALLATTAHLRGDEPLFDDYVGQVLTLNPNFGEMYRILGEQSVMVRLYAEAVEFAREAIRLDPRDWDAYNLLGVNLLRIGEEAAGKDALETAYANDRFNVSTTNTLTLLDSFQNFDRFETPHFKVMLHQTESEALYPYVSGLLEEAYQTLTGKYRFEPEWPITFEMYPHHDDFAVRTLGLPGLGALGVSFGKVVAMDSPSARPPGEFNWGGTLWHEFAHVITLQITDHKIPRWFSEGLSVFEEIRARPGWGEDLSPDFLMAIREDQFLPVLDLNEGFVRPRFPGQITLAYYQASLVCEYIDQMFGFDAILDMLRLYREDRSTAEVFEEALGLTPAAFDRQFNSWVDSRSGLIDLDSFRQWVEAGMAAADAGDHETAIENLSRAVNMYPEFAFDGNPYLPLAASYEATGDLESAIETLDRFASYAEHGFAGLLELARLREEAGDLAGAADALNRVMFMIPTQLDPHRNLGRISLELGRYDDAIREYSTMLALGAPDEANAYYQLARAHHGNGNDEAARTNVMESLLIAPSFEAAQELLLEIAR
jgi:tetratricopeptide (TPR) repeat protein